MTILLIILNESSTIVVAKRRVSRKEMEELISRRKYGSKEEPMVRGRSRFSIKWSDRQDVKMCCSDSEIFDKFKKRCTAIPTDKDADSWPWIPSNYMQRIKMNSFYPYFGSWTNKKNPWLIHVNPTCGFENYQVVDPKKKLSMRNKAIELSEKSNTSLSFKYFFDYCIELGVDNGTLLENRNSELIYENKTVSTLIKITCPPKEERIMARIRLCCPFRQNYNEISNTCNRSIGTPDEYTLLDDVRRYKLNGSISSKKLFDTTFVFYNVFEETDCLFGQSLETERTKLILYEDGRINVDNHIMDHKEYCISDVKPTKQIYSGWYGPLADREGDKNAMIRYCKYPTMYLTWITYVESIFHLISSVCLIFLITYIIYKKCQTVFRAMIVTMAFNLLCMYLGIALAKLGGKQLLLESPKICFITGIIIYFSYLSVMCWLNNLCYDVWSNFPSVTPMIKLRVNIGRYEGFKNNEFKRYALYGWGIPLLITIISLIVHFLPREYTNHMIVPGFANTRCFLDSRLSVLHYQFIPTGVAMILNITFYILFVRNLLCGDWASQNRQRLER